MLGFRVVIGVACLACFSIAEADVFRCKHNGQIFYQDTPCQSQAQAVAKGQTAFDGWMFGTHISEMKRAARRRGLGMAPGTIVFGSTYNESTINRQPNAREYSYMTDLMGKRVKVTLHFTKTTQLLYKISNSIQVAGLKQEERKYFYETLFAKLSQKYGKAQDIETDSVRKAGAGNPLSKLIAGRVTSILGGSLKAWGLNTESVVTLSYKKRYELMSSYKLTYISQRLAATNDRETTREIQQRNHNAVNRDADRL